MQFYKLVGLFAVGSGGQGRKRTADEKSDLLAAKSEAFNKGLRGRAFFYVVNASGSTFTAMAARKDPRMNMEPQFPAYMEALGVKLTDIHVEEVSLHTACNLLRRASRNDYEAHNYKNIPIRTKLKNLNGINTKGSSKCTDLLHKVRYVQRTNGGRGVVLATGTPLCNSISDAYAMQIYLQYDELEKSHLDVFDNWVKTFALPEQLCEIDVDTSKFRFIEPTL